MTCFSDLTGDLLWKIFHYLSFLDLFRAFYGLKKTLDRIVRDYAISINLSQVMDYYSFPCRSLILSGEDLPSFEAQCSYLNLTSLRNVTFIKMNLLTLHSFIRILPLEQLESITIGRLTWHYYPPSFYEEIWSTILSSVNGQRLRSLHLPYYIHHWRIDQRTYDFSALEVATLQYTSCRQMLTFLSRTPNLRQFKACLAAPHQYLFEYKTILPHLQYLELNLQDDWTMKDIQRLLVLCPYVQHLILKVEAPRATTTMFEPITWQNLIEENFVYLISFQLRLTCITTDSDATPYSFQERFNQNMYWSERHPHFQVYVNEIRRELSCISLC